MRPIKLKIKGLNSFIEEQLIDFEKLTERGLFGIFGPTGSGKSTILDGITLALYGEVSRKSTNFINTNCENLNISFEFQITGSEVKRYHIDREFKRDKKSGNPLSGKCKIIDITEEEPVILADKVREVSERCKSIIGLSLEDFTRTVVLPQGQFSEFLKLEGKSRREMLERLFNLQQYGDDLANKLGKEISRNRVSNNQLIGQMKGYEDINQEGLKSLEDELGTIALGYKNALDEFKIIDKNYQESKELWSVKQELLEYKKKEEVLKEKETEIKLKKETLRLGESALKVSPFIIGYESTLREIESSKIEEKKLMEFLNELKKEKIKAEEEWKSISQSKEIELPKLKIKEDRAEDALKEKQSLDLLDVELKRIKELIISLKGERENNEILLKDSLNKIQSINLEIKNSEGKLDGLKIDSTLKEKVQRGIILSEKNDDLKLRVEQNKNKQLVLENKLKEDEISNKELQETFNINWKLLGSKKSILEELTKNSPGEQKDLLVLQKQMGEVKDNWSKFNKASIEIERYKKSIEDINNSLHKKRIEKDEVSKSLLALNELKKQEEIIILSNTLRQELREGEPCPVCGSKEHIHETINNYETDCSKDKEEEIIQSEELLKKINSDITIGETKIQGAIEMINNQTLEISKLGDDYKEKNVEVLEKEFKDLIKLLEDYDSQKKLLEDEIDKLKDKNSTLESQLTKVVTVITQNQKQLEELKDETQRLVETYEVVNKDLLELINTTKINDFKRKNQEIVEVEKEIEIITSKLKIFRSSLDTLNKNKDEIQVAVSNTSERLIKGDSLLIEKENLRDGKISFIKSKVGDEEDILSLINSLKNDMKGLEEAFNKAQEKSITLDKNYQECNEKLIGIIGRLNELISREMKEKMRLNLSLAEEKFENIEEVKNNSITKESIQGLKLEIDEYNNLLSKVSGALESLNKKINNREISEEEFNKLQKDKEDKEKFIEEIKEVKIKKEEEINLIKKKLEEFDGLIKIKAKLDHKLALLGDLEKLFKGKKFVEFVAISRLKYISKEASKRLIDITSGTYGLEVDENGRFIIRDYKNGGISRDTSTLSGGETFLASLALALALSAEIQLKGTAPLELFFLDEGFGTLDDNLLEIVMSSLERIHNDKLKVGIISHVESIKNRVPVKLIITPAESGMGGSKVRIEKS